VAELMGRVELPDGHHAELREVEDLRRGDVRAALKAADAQGVNLAEGQFGLDGIGALQDGLLVRFIRSWTLTNGDGVSPLPVTIDALQDLPLSVYQPLAAEIAPALAQVLGGGQTVDPTSAAPSSPPANTD
jgi:hypothetical protein